MEQPLAWEGGGGVRAGLDAPLSGAERGQEGAPSRGAHLPGGWGVSTPRIIRGRILFFIIIIIRCIIIRRRYYHSTPRRQTPGDAPPGVPRPRPAPLDAGPRPPPAGRGRLDRRLLL